MKYLVHLVVELDDSDAVRHAEALLRRCGSV